MGPNQLLLIIRTQCRSASQSIATDGQCGITKCWQGEMRMGIIVSIP
jgi:hypothetical protein